MARYTSWANSPQGIDCYLQLNDLGTVAGSARVLKLVERYTQCTDLFSFCDKNQEKFREKNSTSCAAQLLNVASLKTQNLSIL